jgi:4'-phosphopantetheinyl transferase EntD
VTRIGRAAELAGVAEADAGLHARRLFAAKEAAYKALWPTLRVFIEFQEVEVRFLEGGAWRIESRCAQLPEALADAVRGRIAVRAGLLVATAAIAAGDG